MQNMSEGYQETCYGKLPVEWDLYTIEELCDIVDYRGKTPEKVDEGIFLVTAKNIGKGFIDYSVSKEYIREDEYDKVMSRGLPAVGDVLFTTEAPLGNVANVDNEKIALAQRVIKLRGNKKLINNYYLKYFMLGDSFQKEIYAQATGSTVSGIKGSRLKKILIVTPSLNEQNKIATILSTVDQQIEQTDAMLEKTKELKKGLMQKLLTKGIGHTKFRDTEVGRIPAGWELLQLSEVANVNPSYKLNKGEMYDFIDMASLPTEGLSIGEMKDREYGTNSGSKFKNGDTLFARITPCAENGKMAFVNCLNTEYGLGSTEFIVISPKQNFIDPLFLFYCVRSERVRNYAISRMLGTTGRQRIPNEVFKEELKIALPPFDEQRKIADLLYWLDKDIDQYEQKKERLNDLKKGLMHNLLTGKVRVRV